MPSTPLDLPAQLNQLNKTIPIGSSVRYWTGLKQGPGELGHTRTTWFLLEGHTLCVWIHGVGTCIASSHVELVDPHQQAVNEQKRLFPDCSLPDICLRLRNAVGPPLSPARSTVFIQETATMLCRRLNTWKPSATKELADFDTAVRRLVAATLHYVGDNFPHLHTGGTTIIFKKDGAA